mmetsp:Transcript_52746/g.112064  ORF Transcript_52746/g.112064 Transcript_52746/m.112064 type:complete len:92 (-) Transcript_52746:370-645(-)
MSGLPQASSTIFRGLRALGMSTAPQAWGMSSASPQAKEVTFKGLRTGRMSRRARASVMKGVKSVSHRRGRWGSRRGKEEVHAEHHAEPPDG